MDNALTSLLSHAIAEVIRRLEVIKETRGKLVTNKQDELDDDDLTAFLQRPLSNREDLQTFEVRIEENERERKNDLSRY